MTTKTAAEIYRDYVTAGVPASGAHQPIKSDIRQYLGEIETSIALVDAAIASDTASALSRLEIARRSALFHIAI